MVATVSSSVSSKVAFFMMEQKKEKENAVSAKVAFQKNLFNNRRKKKKIGRSGIKDKLAMFQKIEHEAEIIIKKQNDVKNWFEKRHKKAAKTQTKQKLDSQTDYAIGSTVITNSNPVLTGTVLSNLRNDIVPVKLGWATAYIAKNNIRPVKTGQSVDIVKRQREENSNNLHPSKKTKGEIKQQIKQNASQYLEKNQNTPTKFVIGSAVTTISNPLLTGTVVSNVDKDIVPVKLQWATAYITQNNLKLVKN